MLGQRAAKFYFDNGLVHNRRARRLLFAAIWSLLCIVVRPKVYLFALCHARNSEPILDTYSNRLNWSDNIHKRSYVQDWLENVGNLRRTCLGRGLDLWNDFWESRRIGRRTNVIQLQHENPECHSCWWLPNNRVWRWLLINAWGRKHDTLCFRRSNDRSLMWCADLRLIRLNQIHNNQRFVWHRHRLSKVWKDQHHRFWSEKPSLN